MPKWENIFLITTKYTKCRKKSPKGLKSTYQNGHKIYPNFPFTRPYKINQNWDFGLKTNHLATLVLRHKNVPR
jgi:hypothetical protein